MSTESKHTPLPWKIEHEPGSYLPYITAGNKTVAGLDSGGCSLGPDEILANASLIVRAVNCHHGMLEALKGMIEANGGVAVMPTHEAKKQNEALKIARAAIKSAEEVERLSTHQAV